MSTLIAPLFNFFLLVALLVYLLREPIRGYVKQRQVSMGEAVQRVRQMLREAQEQYDEFSAKLKAIDAEVASLREQSRQDAQASRNRIIGEAQRMSSLIVSDARISAENVYRDLKTRLRAELASRVLERVELLVKERLTGDDRAKIRQEFSAQVEGAQVGSAQ